jgi:hypothetical protein
MDSAHARQEGGVSLSTVVRMEESDDTVEVGLNSVVKVTRAFQLAGIEFENDSRPGARLNLKAQKQK